MGLALAVAYPPSPPRWANDQAGFIQESTRAALDARLEAYQGQTGHQVVVWIGDTIGDADLADWAVHTFQAWKVGRKGLDDGLVMFVLAKDHKIDIEVGYGLEGAVPDALAGRIINEIMVPKIRAGDPDGAVRDGVEAILTAIEGKPVPTLQTPPPPSGGGRTGVPWTLLIVAILFVALAIFSPRTALWLLWVVASGRGGGGLGGGGGGGFSGGGGRSGGGGARGGW